MFHSVTWSHYFLYLLVATLLYYILVWVLLFKAKFPPLSFLDQPMHTPSFHGEDEPDETMVTAQTLMDELRPVFAGRTHKQELILALQVKLRRYLDHPDPAFRTTINSFIEQESQQQCSIRLGEDELRTLWIQA